MARRRCSASLLGVTPITQARDGKARASRATLQAMPSHTRPAPTAARRSARGFTLIEQIAAVAVIGTVSATALSSLIALGGSLASAIALYQAGCMVTDQRPVTGKCQRVRSCADVAGLLLSTLPADDTVPAQPLPSHGGSCSVVRMQDGIRACVNGVATGGCVPAPSPQVSRPPAPAGWGHGPRQAPRGQTSSLLLRPPSGPGCRRPECA